MRILGACLFAFCLLQISCSSHRTLLNEELAKLDPPLQELLSHEKPDESLFDVQTRPDGQKTYSVIIRSSNAEELRSRGVAIGSVLGDVVTARLTLRELQNILSLPSVRAVQTGTKNYPQ